MKYATIVALLVTTASALVNCESEDDCDSKTACCGYAYEGDEMIGQVCSEEDEEDPDLTELAEQGFEAAEFSCDEPELDDTEGASRLAIASVAALGLLYLA